MQSAPDLIEFLGEGQAAAQRPWPRFRLTPPLWDQMIFHLTVSDWDLLSIWGDGESVHAAFYEPAGKAIAVASVDCQNRRFASLSEVRPGAIRMERAIQDLFGLEAVGLTDRRPWLDHGQWTAHRPLGASSAAEPRQSRDYDFLAVEGGGLHQIPVGPVHAGVIEPGHFRFHANGEAVVRLEARLGYAHKGNEGAMAGKSPADAARLAARLSGDSTVACSLSFARAVEAATDTRLPPRAEMLRGLMAELERVANHLGDVGAICNDASFAFMLAHCSVLREMVLRKSMFCFGHRLMMDVVVPGGVARDIAPDGAAALRALTAEVRTRFAMLAKIYDEKPSLLDRTVTTGTVGLDLVRGYAAGGHVGRASGRDFDSRRDASYAPYDRLAFEVPVLTDGDVHSRLMIRVREIAVSLGLIDRMLEGMPDGPVHAPLGNGRGEGLALAEGFRGDYLAWVALAQDGTVRRAHLRDPSWMQWPLLEAAIEGNIVADFPLCNKSFNCSYSGHDL
jgi:Ni,Fe-hydrogenase III large subunit